MSEASESCRVAEGFRFGGVGPLPTGFERFDALQDQHRMWWVDEPEGSYWMVLDRELTVDRHAYAGRSIENTGGDSY